MAECNCPIPTYLHDVGCPMFDPNVGNATVAPFKCCGAGDPPCRTFEESCQNEANYDTDFGYCPKCKRESFPFCATSGCPASMKVRPAGPAENNL